MDIFVEICGNKVRDAVSHGKLIFGFFSQSAVNVLKEDLYHVRKAIGSASAYQDQSVHTSILIEIAECEGGVKASCIGPFGCEAGLCVVRQAACGRNLQGFFSVALKIFERQGGREKSGRNNASC